MNATNWSGIDPGALRMLSHQTSFVRTFGLFSFIRTKTTGVKPPPDHLGPAKRGGLGLDHTELWFGSGLL